DEEVGEDGVTRTGNRRRRGRRGRGGRGTGGAAGGEDSADSDEGDAAATQTDTADDDGMEDDGTGARRRRRRRRTGTGEGGEDGLSPDDPPNTVVHVRQPRSNAPDDNVRGVKGSTRIEAKRQRRRDGRETQRRRPSIITEAEFLARREAVDRVMIVK